jgi:signal transduction histidine kinase/ligand-binding sensor domain-containing protein
MFTKCLLCFLIILIAAIDGYAQDRFDSWTTNDGLPQNQINGITQTRDGYLWLTTFNGLVRYDGVRFKVFNPGNTKGLNTNRMLNLIEDPDGNLWITTEHSGVIRFRNGEFITYTFKDGLPDNRVSIRLFKQETASYPIFYSPKGIVKFLDEKFTPCNEGELGPFEGISFQTSPTAAWYVESNGLHKVENGREVVHLPISGFKPESFFKIFEDRQGNLWLRMTTGELKRYREGVITTYSIEDGSLPHSVFSFCEDRQGNNWFGSLGGGLGLFKDDKFIYLTTDDGLLTNKINSIYEDREGNLWIGTSGGLNRLRDYIITTYSKKDGLSSDNIYPIYQDSKGDIWIGSTPGLTKYSNGVFSQYDEIDRDLVLHTAVKSIMEDREGNLWFGLEVGIVRTKDEQIVYKNREKPFFDRPVRAIYQDKAGIIWFGTERGLIKLKDGLFTAYTAENGLAGNFVSAIYEDSGGTLWIGTQFGLSAMRGESFRNYGEKEGLSGYLVRAIYEDSDGVLWIGTYDGGLNRLKDGRITSYTTKEGLYDNGVSQILEDETGNLWMSCNLGIYRVQKRELNELAEGKIKTVTCVAYGERDGMLASECNGGGQPAGTKARDGRFWFPTVKGVAVLDPAAVPRSNQPPPVVIEEILVDNETVPYGGMLTIQPGKENFEIHYTALSFIMSNQCKFKYKLEGYNNDWIDAGPRRTAYYSHVPPGNYNFIVRGANRDGVENLEGVKIPITVVPPYWQTWWFKTLMVCTLVAAVLIFYMWRVAALKRERAAQEVFSRQLIESQENERKRLAAELHDSLAQSLLVIKNRALLAMRALNKESNTFEQLNEITTTTDLVIDEVSEISYNLRPYQLDKLGLGRAIEVMLERVSGSSGIIFTSDIDAVEGLFQQQAEISIYRIVQECVNNVVKHSGASEANLKIERDTREIRIIICDNGKGFDREANNLKRSMKSGFGLTGIAERTRMLGGKHSIQSKPGAGTTITIQINLLDIRYEDADNHSISRRSSNISERA